MPLTNPEEPMGSGDPGPKQHVWFNPEPGALAVRLDKPATEEKIMAACGAVHVYHADELTPIREQAGHPDDLEAWLSNNFVCTTCADIAREELGLPTRAIDDVPGVGGRKAKALSLAGYATVADLRESTQEELATVDGIGNALAARIKADVGNNGGSA